MVLLCHRMPDLRSTPEITAVELLHAVSVGRDKQAFAELFGRYAPRLKAWFVRSGPAGRADELTQEVMLRVWRKAHLFDPQKASVSTWIFSIARNARVDHLRKKRPAVHDTDPALIPAEPADLDHALDVQRSAHNLQCALSELPDAQAAVLQAAYFEHKTLRAIAGELDVPLGTIKSRVRLAITSLRKALGAP
ncbi:MAG: sigma-70 family RNA polymerase sigma factor [Myxococcota bacterium]